MKYLKGIWNMIIADGAFLYLIAGPYAVLCTGGGSSAEGVIIANISLGFMCVILNCAISVNAYQRMIKMGITRKKTFFTVFVIVVLGTVTTFASAALFSAAIGVPYNFSANLISVSAAVLISALISILYLTLLMKIKFVWSFVTLFVLVAITAVLGVVFQPSVQTVLVVVVIAMSAALVPCYYVLKKKDL